MRDTLAWFNKERGSQGEGGDAVSKRGRKKRDRKKNAANHGKRPNS